MLELLAALAKFALYVGSFAAAGTALAGLSLDRQLGAGRDAQPKLIGAAAALMLVATLAGALISVLRLGGQIDGPTLSAIWETPAGPAIALQVIGATLLLAFRRAGGIYGALRIVGAVCALASFGVNGHSASIGFLTGAVAFAHVCATSWWLGSLLLIREAGRVMPDAELSRLVDQFSAHAIIVVSALAICGVILTLSLIDFSRPEWLTPYAQALTLKIALAVFVLGTAIYNKMQITPRLTAADATGARALNHTIGIELGVFAAVFLATAWLTTFNSPHA